MRQPVIEYALETPLSTMVRSYSAGQALTMFLNCVPSQRMCSYMSSLAIHTCGWRSSTSPSAFSSASEYTLPVGLDGLLSTSSLVRGVMAASSCAGLILKWLSRPVSMATGVAPASSTMSGYDTQYGAGMITSSPSSSSTCARL